MADVFLSYASPDRPIAERLARAIQQAGLSVWWDRHIKGGHEFTRDIEQQLESARHVLVLWSKEAVNSRWVRDEASVAADSKRLVAATIDGTPAPLGFRQFQTIDLKKWTSRSPDLPPELLEALDLEAAEFPLVRRGPGRRLPRAAIIGGLLLAVAGALAVVRPGPIDDWLSGESKEKTLALAIMPFATEGGRDVDYLGPGMASALADSLAPLSGLRITATTSTQAIAGKGLTASDIGRQLGVSHLVEGNVQQSGDRFVIAVRLIAATSSQQVWARTFEGASNDLQGLKSDITRELAGAIGARLGVGEGKVAERGKVEPDAYEAYLRALERVSVREDRTARNEAIKQFRLAASIQPDFAEAHAGHAYLLALSVPSQLGMSWPELLREQRRSTERALALDPRNDLALVAKATALQNFDGEVEKSLALAQAVVNRSPNLAPANYSLAAGLWMAGRPREAIDRIDLAIDRDPFDNLLRFYRAKILYSLGDYQAVRQAAEQCAQRCAGVGWYWLLAIAGFGDEDTYREDFPLVMKRAKADGITPEDVEEAKGIVEGYILGRSYKPKPIDDGGYAEFLDAALDARFFGFETGLRTAQNALLTSQADSVLDILNDGRVTFTPQQRADPRYHALFRHAKLAKIAASRRAKGMMAGLPVFPVKPYTGR